MESEVIFLSVRAQLALIFGSSLWVNFSKCMSAFKGAVVCVRERERESKCMSAFKGTVCKGERECVGVGE